MSHKTETVAARTENGHYIVTIRCCGDSDSDFNHSMAVEVFSDAAKRAASIAEAHKLCAAHHDMKSKAIAALQEQIGGTVEHSF